MIICSKALSYVDATLFERKQKSLKESSSIKLIYELACTIFRVSLYTLFTFVTPMGSLATSLGCCIAFQAYKYFKERDLRVLLAKQDEEARQRILVTTEVLRDLNRWEHEFELVNSIALSVFNYINIPFTLICLGISLWSWYLDETEIMSYQQDIRSPGLDNSLFPSP